MRSFKFSFTTSIAPLLALFAIGCANENFPKYQKLDGFRVIGIQADKPEVLISTLPATVTLTPVLSDSGSGGRTVTITGSACPDPGVNFGAEPTCDQSPLKVDLSIPSVTPGAVAANSQVFGTPSLTGSTPPFTVTVPPGLTTGRSAPDLFNGIGYLISLRFQAGDKVVRAYKRIAISNKSTANVNPSVTSVLGNGSALTVLPTSDVTLSVLTSAPASYESMNTEGAITSRTESLRVTYFHTDGLMKFARLSPAETNIWTPPATAPTGRPATLVVVVYDGLGGMAFQVIDL
jgi:hypothetical protein